MKRGNKDTYCNVYMSMLPIIIGKWIILHKFDINKEIKFYNMKKKKEIKY